MSTKEARLKPRCKLGEGCTGPVDLTACWRQRAELDPLGLARRGVEEALLVEHHCNRAAISRHEAVDLSNLELEVGAEEVGAECAGLTAEGSTLGDQLDEVPGHEDAELWVGHQPGYLPRTEEGAPVVLRVLP